MTNNPVSGRIVTKAEPVPQQDRWALEYLVSSHDEKNIRLRREKLRDDLKQYITDNCEQDENGNYVWEFASPVTLFADKYPVSGLMAQRRVSEFINEDKAWEIVEKYGIRDQVVDEIITYEIDFDKMYALNQQGVISDEDIDSILDIKETFALTKIEG